MTAGAARRLAEACGIPAEPVRERAGGYSNEAWLARASGERLVVVRRYGRLNVSRSALFYEHAVMRHASERTAFVYAPLETAGESLRLLEGRFVGMLPFVPGETGERRAFAPAAQTLARFHRAMHGFRANRPRATRTLGTLAWLRERFVRFAHDPTLARAVDWNVAIAAVAGATARIAPRVTRLPLGVVHGDAHPDNVVTRMGTAVALIDFDFTHESERAYDVATAADSYARDAEDGALDARRFAAFVRGYDAALPLAPDEWSVLWDMAIRRSAMLVWYVVTRHGERRRGDVGRAPVYVERLRELERYARAAEDLRAVS
ncbi:MAG: phosphotransferase [Candidatus Eremiobacteraeota bacterium]|nr:phosphotransferase [Candidatus Eremiobacteraeota bacterium]